MVLNDVTEFVRNGASIKQEKGCKGTPITRIETISNSRFNYDRLGYADIFDDKYQDYYLQENDVLLSHINSEKHLGRAVVYKQLTDENIIHGMNLLCLRFIKSRYNPSYFCYYSQSDIAKMYISRNTKKSVNQASITATAIKNMPIPATSIEEQQNVVHCLDSVKLIIDLYNEQVKKLDELIKSRFVEMFGDPKINIYCFEKKNLKESCDIITGNTPSRANAEYYGNHIEWIKTDNILTNQLYPSQADEFLSADGMNVGRYVDKGSILMSCIAGSLSSIGRVCITDRKVAFNQQINALVPKDYNVIFLYVLLLLSKDYLLEGINMALKGILSKSGLGNKQLIIPPTDLQNQFADFVTKVEQQKATVQKSIDKLETLKKSLMQEYFG